MDNKAGLMSTKTLRKGALKRQELKRVVSDGGSTEGLHEGLV